MKTFILCIILLFFNFLLAKDPDWLTIHHAGGSESDIGSEVVVDNSGNCYITGKFTGTVNFGSYSLTSFGMSDIFVAKIDVMGNWLWAVRAGGNTIDISRGITIDDNGNSYITGIYGNNASFGPYTLINNTGYYDVFVAKLDSSGNWLWASRAGGIRNDWCNAIALDNEGNSYITGQFVEEAIFGTDTLTTSGYYDGDIFVAKIDTNGNWIKALNAGGVDSDQGFDIVIDNSNNCFITGFFVGSATFGSNIITGSGLSDIFIAKLAVNGDWIWALQAGGEYWDEGYSVSLDEYGNSCVTGRFYNSATFGPYSITSSGDYDIYVAKIDANGNWLWVTQAGGSMHDQGNGIKNDDDGCCYITGWFSGEVSFGSNDLTSYSIDFSDIVVAKLDENGNWLWAKQAGGIDDDAGYGITIDVNGCSYITGYFKSIASFGEYTLTSNGDKDIFIAKLESGTSAENYVMQLSNHPNPFSTSTIIDFSIQNDSQVELSIFNIKGQKVKQLINDRRSLGQHSVIWNGDNESGESVSSGVYFYKLMVNDKTKVVKKCLLLK